MENNGTREQKEKKIIQKEKDSPKAGSSDDSLTHSFHTE